ncbi:MAG: serine protease [Patescibacteria group bacterium]
MNNINWSLRVVTTTAFFLFVAFVAHLAQAEEYITDPSDLPDENAYKAVVLINSFSSFDGENLYQYASGSGIIISSDGVILTNHHVVTLEDEFNEGEYKSVYQICLSSSIDQAPDCHYAAKLLAKDKDQDLALLKIEPITGLSTQTNNFKYLNLASVDNTEVNDTAIVMGYPGIGGGTITITRGIISGKEEKFNKKWIKTDAVLSFGSSGGAAIDSQGNVIGLVNASHSDYVSSLGYLINIASINTWINSNKNLGGQQNSYLEDLKSFSKFQKNLENTNNFSNDYFSITKPADWEFTYNHEAEINIDNPSDDEGGYVIVKMFKYPYNISLETAVNSLKDSFVKNGLLTVINFTTVENTLINNQAAKKIILSHTNDTETLYYLVNKNYLIEVDYDYGVNEKDEDLIRGVINSLTLVNNNKTLEKLSQYTNTSPQFSIKADGDWHILSKDIKKEPVVIYNEKIPEAYISISVAKGDENTKNYNNQQYLDYLKQILSTANTSAASLDFLAITKKEDADYYLNEELNSVISFEGNFKKISSEEVLMIGTDYIVKSGDKYMAISFNMFTGNETAYQTALAKAQEVIKTFSLSASPHQTETVVEDTEKPKVPAEVTKQPIYVPPVKVGSLANRLKGRILLQVESHGEAWYVKPETGTRMYMKDGSAAYGMMRELGLGITNADLAKIPVGLESRFECQDSDSDELCDKLEQGLGSDPSDSDSDNDGYNDGTEINTDHNPLGVGKMSYNNTLINRLQGKIVLQVESRGEAWYINPVDGKRYYMPDGPSAYQIMRYLSLGITNKDLESISAE